MDASHNWMYLADTIADRNVASRSSSEGFNPDDEDLSDASFLDRACTENPEDAIIARLDGEIEDESEVDLDEALEELLDEEALFDAVDAEIDPGVEASPVIVDVAGPDDEELPRRLPSQRLPQDDDYDARRYNRDRTVHDRVLCSSRRGRIADQLEVPAPQGLTATEEALEALYGDLDRVWEMEMGQYESGDDDDLEVVYQGCQCDSCRQSDPIEDWDDYWDRFWSEMGITPTSTAIGSHR